VYVSFEEQFSDQLQFRLRCVRTHLNSFLVSGLCFHLLVVRDDGFEKIAEALVAAGVVLARYL
jgi:hypothetical protein